MSEIIDFDESLNQDDEYDERFDCDYSSVDEVINKVEIFTGAKELETENGFRTLISYGKGPTRSAFFTSSKKLKDVVNNPSVKFPFRAIVKVVEYGINTGFAFRSPKCKVSESDIENFDRYKKGKHRRNR